MSQLQENIQAVFAQPRMVAFATVTSDGKPWVRYVMAAMDAHMNIMFATSLHSRKVGQLKSNQECHVLAGVTDLASAKNWVQVQGKGEVLTDQKVKDGFWSPALANYFSGPQDPSYAVIKVTPHRIEYAAMGGAEPEVWRDPSRI